MYFLKNQHKFENDFVLVSTKLKVRLLQIIFFQHFEGIISLISSRSETLYLSHSHFVYHLFHSFSLWSFQSSLLYRIEFQFTEYSVVSFTLEIQVFVDNVSLRQHAVVFICISNGIRLLLFNNFCDYILNLQELFLLTQFPFFMV